MGITDVHSLLTVPIGTRGRSRGNSQSTISAGGEKEEPVGENSTRSTGYCLTGTVRYAFA